MTSKQLTGTKRNIIDKFYTSDNTVKLCIFLIKNNLDIKQDDLIIEPSAGNGSFIEDIKKLSKNYIFYDIEPENSEIIKQDFLQLEIKMNRTIHYIGNPPFGRQSSTCIKFIKKCCLSGQSISFILPKSFKKDSMRKYFSSKFHLIAEIDIPDNSFLVNNKEHNVPCVFQIWKKMTYNREEIKKLEPIGYSFVKKYDVPDISFRRVGVYAGKIDNEIESKSEQSHYFIKFDNYNEDILNTLKNIVFNNNNTTGPKSISKQEIIKEFNRVLN